MSQRDALMFVYESTSGKRWTKRMHWSTEYHLSSWEGVKIDACGHVQSLVLNSNGLSGEIKFSDRLKPLQHVENLSLSSNALFGDVILLSLIVFGFMFCFSVFCSLTFDYLTFFAVFLHYILDKCYICLYDIA